jgi:sporulation protein YlmC with PRC-barrel domain
MTTTSNATNARNLLSVNDEALSLNDSAEDVRNYTVVDRDGEDIGQVDDLLVDDGEHKVRFLRIKEGGFLGIGAKYFLIPVDAIARIEGENVHVGQQRSHVGAGPSYDPAITADEAWRSEAHRDGGYYDGLYGHYGYTPFWVPGYAYPGFPFYG